MKKRFLTCRLPAMLLVLAMLLSMSLVGCRREEATDGGSEGPIESQGPEDGQVLYTIRARGEGGMLLSGVTVTLSDNQGIQAATGTTDENGEYQIWLYPARYTVALSDLRPGYTAETVTTTAEGGVTEVICNTQLITEYYPSQPSEYLVGDVMYDFAYAVEGQEIRLSELLEDKKLVVINFWYASCSPCKAEFPAIQNAYETYSDDVAVVAFNISDTAEKTAAFKDENGYTFTMIKDIGLYDLFATMAGGRVAPITVFVDRYGVIADYIMGGDSDKAAWLAEFEYYISDGYTQNGSSGYVDDGDEDVELPDVEMPSSAVMEAAANASGFNFTYTASDDETVWPWVNGADKDGNTYIEPSNYGKASSSAMITTTVTLKAGEVFAFDYEFSIEVDEWGSQIYDMFAVYVDGHIQQKLITEQDGKVTCYAYTPTEAGTYTITLVYTKDEGDGYGFMVDGEEYIHVSNIRLVTVAEMTKAGGSLNVYHAAATGVPTDAEAENLNSSYKNYVTVVYNEEDGYYHVHTADGPLLLAKLTGSTAWSSTSLYSLGEAEYLYVDKINYYHMFYYDSTRSYIWLESYSQLGYAPVDGKLAELLQLIAANVGDGKNHEYEWLEFCSYFEHYGVGTGIVSVLDVRQGLDPESALEANLGEDNWAYINQPVVPRGYYFKFVPDKTGVYTFYSIEEGSFCADGYTFSTTAWLYDEDGNILDEGYGSDSDENFHMWKTLEAGKTYYVAVGFDPVDTLGGFYFGIKYVGNKYDVLTACTAGWTTTQDYTTTIIQRNRDIYAVLGEDGYYHQVLSYDEDGNPILDTSDTGYLYIDFLGLAGTEGGGYLTMKGSSFATLARAIDEGYWIWNSDTSAYEHNTAPFNFSTRVDLSEELAEEFGDWQTVMEEYLAQVLEKSYDLDEKNSLSNVSYTLSADGATLNFSNYRLVTDEEGNVALYKITSATDGSEISTFCANLLKEDDSQGFCGTWKSSLEEVNSRYELVITETGVTMRTYRRSIDPECGLLKADEQLVTVLTYLMTLHGLTNNVTLTDGSSYTVAVEDQWMMFAAFFRHA